ncbi:2-oxo-4-hydroxy-4-carboxy-5-ureidoimidazoline decarboxylase [Streptomyces sp. NPDC127084]|uniref:2-oxo-4-hydroxy-4-carboxy-5-ureidoimidazoline decarboxylase n=1 Tax=Streptomyces sp. NPDC127084 TaxID=3347133 RepID=UPI00366796B6
MSRSSESHSGLPRVPAPAGPSRGSAGTPSRSRLPGLERFNTASAGSAEATLLGCCGSRRWSRRIAAHRPYPDLHALLAAADEAGYDLSGTDLHEALAGETSVLPPDAPPAARMALDAAHTAYLDRFGHAFVICLEGYRPDEQLDQTLAAIRSRLGNDPDDERVIAADELRRLTRFRLSRAMATATAAATVTATATAAPTVPVQSRQGHSGCPEGRSDSPSVPV